MKYYLSITFAFFHFIMPQNWLKTTTFRYKKKRVMGIEPTYTAWKAVILPLNYTRVTRIKYHDEYDLSTNFFVKKQIRINQSHDRLYLHRTYLLIAHSDKTHNGGLPIASMPYQAMPLHIRSAAARKLLPRPCG